MAMVAVGSSLAARTELTSRSGASAVVLPWGQRMCLRLSMQTRQPFLKIQCKKIMKFSESSKRTQWRVFCEADKNLSKIAPSSDEVTSMPLEEIGESETNFADSLNTQVQLDLNLPRRSLLVEFTCDVCKARTQRLINPKAHRSGTVFVQCAGCKAYHKLVDNLNLIEEFDFRNEVASETADVDL